MKIKNDLTSIKIGDKHYDFNNLILDEYLNKFVCTHRKFNNLGLMLSKRKLNYCLLKFDIPFSEVSSSSKIKNQDFDICFVGAKCNQDITENQIVIQYDYDTNFIYDYKETVEMDLSKYYGKKITAIGFNVTWMPYSFNSIWKYYTCAILDISNYNIYLQKNQELSITRRDIITTDTIFYSNDKKVVPGAVHLAPCGIPQIISQPIIYDETGESWSSFYDCGYGILYSVGLSSYTDYIDKEFIIGKDLQIVENKTELIIKGIENYLVTDNSFFCDKNIYCNTNIYPVRANYKYVILKYKIYQEVHSGTYDNIIAESTDTGYYYYQAIPVDKFGKTNLIIKYERG